VRAKHRQPFCRCVDKVEKINFVQKVLQTPYLQD
jgi:hypothetical protein